VLPAHHALQVALAWARCRCRLCAPSTCTTQPPGTAGLLLPTSSCA
jgi:hypothetical protein